MTIGENIRECRGTMKQEDLAAMIGVNVATLSRWENNQNIPNGQMLTKIAETLNIPTSYLLNEKDNSTHQLVTLAQQNTNEDSELKEPITAGIKNNMYIIKIGEIEFYLPNDEYGRETFCDFLSNSLKGNCLGLTDTYMRIKQQINNGTNSSYHDSIVNNGSSSTQVEMSETA